VDLQRGHGQLSAALAAGRQDAWPGFDGGLTVPGEPEGDRTEHRSNRTRKEHSMDTTTSTFDTEALRRSIEERDATALTALYAPDAEMTVVDRNAPPSRPRVLRGRTAIGEYLDETCGRDMTHRLERVVVSGDTAAFTQACRYPDGTRVLCLAMLDLRDGLIVSQTAVQEWDA
jgi:ketosteroid isomerase-like protein